MSQTAKAGVALLCGLITLYGLALLCITNGETLVDRLWIILSLWIFPLSVLIVYLVAKILRFRPDISSSTA